MRIAVLSDTHAPRFWKRCPDAVKVRLEDVELILHAGDVCTAAVLDELATWAPVVAVRGNNDGADVARRGAPDEARLELCGVLVGMVHDSGPKDGRLPRLRRRFPDRDLIVFGHSHIPFDAEQDGLRIFNPGSPTDRRRQPYPSMGLLEVAGGKITSLELIRLPVVRPAGRRS